ADRIGMAALPRPARQRSTPGATPANDPGEPPAALAAAPPPESNPGDDAVPAPNRADDAAARAARIWASARSAPEDHPYLVAKQGARLVLRKDASRRLVVPLQELGGRIHSLETIAPDGAKRYLAGGAKNGHFAVVGAEPAPIAEPAGPLLICEGWATGASLHMVTGHRVVAAMDAGNLMPVAEALRAHFPAADSVLVADNEIG